MSLKLRNAMEFVRVAITFSAAVLLARNGYKKGSLSFDGCVAAFFVGFVALYVSFYHGILLLAFYYSGSRLTRLRTDSEEPVLCFF